MSPRISDSPEEGRAALDDVERAALPAAYRAEATLSRRPGRSVVLATAPERDRRVVLTMLAKRNLAPADLDRVDELRALAAIGSRPHVLPIEAVIDSGTALCLVSPYLEGGDLDRRLEARANQPISVAEALRIASQLCQALEAVHAAGFAHGDVKPGNIVLDARGDAYLGDFGLATDAAARDGAEISGTPAYLPPEQFSGALPGPSGDLYSLGCVLYELTTGRPPFLGEHASEVLRLHQVARPAAPIERNPELPRALSDLILKLIEKDPALRPASAGDVRAALEGMLRGENFTAGIGAARRAAAPAERAALRELPFVAREQELASLGAALARSREGSASLVLISGDAGAGKSRLLAELRARAEAQGCVVLCGHGDEHDAASYQPFVDALQPLSGHFSELELAHAELLRTLTHREARRSATVARLPRGLHSERLFAAVFAALSAFAKTRPLVLLLEDLHAFDLAALELFEHLACALRESAARQDLELLVVATTRPPANAALVTRFAALRSESRCQELTLEPFDERAIFQLVSALGTLRPTGQVIHELLRATEGNPLFVCEVLRRIAEAGAPDEQAPSAATLSSLPLALPLALPPTIGAAIAERVASLGPASRELLQLAALLGPRFGTPRLAALSGLPARELAASLDEAVAAGVLSGAGEGHAFTHPLIRQSLLDLVAPAAREALHLRIAQRLLARAEEDAGAAHEIAHHLVRAGALADPTELAEYAGRAGAQALQRFAWREAAELLEAALGAAQRGAKLEPREIAELHRGAGLAYFRLLDSKPCLEHYDTANQGFERIGDSVGLARTQNERVRVALWLGFVGYGELGQVRPLEVALARLGEREPALRAQLLSTLAEACWAAREHERAEAFALAALEQGRAAGDHRLCAEASIDLGLAQFLSLRPKQALQTWQRGVAHAREAQDLFAEEFCLVRSGLALAATARFDDAQRAVRRVEEMNHVLQLPGESSIACGVLLTLATLRGEFEEAERHAADAIDRVRRARYPWSTIFVLPALSCARALRNDVAGAYRAVQQLSELGLGFENPATLGSLERFLRWLADWVAGDASEIDAKEVAELLRELERPPDLSNGTTACALVELADALQQPSWAAAASPLLETAQRQGFVFWCSWPFFVPRLRGVAASLLGDDALAERQLALAIEIAERVGARLEHARAQLDLARLLATRNTGNDRSRACELAHASRLAFSPRGPAAFVARAERLCAFLSERGS